LDDFHFWYLYDVTTGEIIKNKTEIIDFISCPPDEKRVIPDFFNKIYEVNEKIIDDIESSYKELEQEENVDTELPKISKDPSSKFIHKIIREVNSCLSEFSEDKSIEELWDKTKDKLINIPLTKRRLQKLRKIWSMYEKSNNWKKLIYDLNIFLKDIWPKKKIKIPPFDRNALKLVVIDFIS
jgi:hypothetical protein